ncbi:MAG: glycosyltransferase, partial [Chitinivibrionales bacterium]|nr:glycosyltransferase [Chitinivibrionales bacterium]
AETLAYPRSRVVVTYPGIDDAFVNRQATPPRLARGEPLRVVSVGRLVARKGFDRVIESLAVLRSRGLQATCTLVGKGDQEPLRSLAERMGVADLVTFAGYVPDTEALINALREAHVLAMVSRVEGGGTDVEGFGTVYLEAGALKRPAVAGRSGGVPEAVVHGETGLLVDNPDSPEAIADAFAELIEHPALLRRMGEAACRRVHESFRQPVLYARLHEELRRLVSAE